MGHSHQVYDRDLFFQIDPLTRRITNNSGKVVIVQHDHCSERFTFDIPRYIEGHDMSLCDRVEIHYLNGTNAGVYLVSDLSVSSENQDTCQFSWLISNNATQLVGPLNFVVRFVCATDGNVDYAWHTIPYSGVTVSTSIYNSDVIIQTYPDALAQWEARIAALEQSDTILTVNGISPDETGNVEVQGVNINSAVPGQLIIVKAVDETGKPTEWEAIDRTHYVENTDGTKEYSWILDNSGGWMSGTDLEFATLFHENYQDVIVTKYSSKSITNIVEKEIVDTTNSINGTIYDHIYYYTFQRELDDGDYANCFFLRLGVDSNGNLTGDYSIGEHSASWETITLSIPYTTETVHKLDNRFIDAEWMATLIEDREVVLEKQTLTFADSGEVEENIPSGIVLENGENYQILFEGKTWVCEARQYESDGTPCIVVGMRVVTLTENEYEAPISFIYVASYGVTIISDDGLPDMLGLEKGGNYVVGLSRITKTYNRLPQEYLPADVPTTTEVQTMIDTELADVPTTTEVQTMIDTELADVPTTTEVQTMIDTELADVPTTTEVQTMIDEALGVIENGSY